MVGIDTAFNYLQNFGFSTLSDTDRVYSLPLGGLTEGVTMLELTAAYASLANQGTYIEPILYTKVISMDGSVLIDNVPNTHQVVSASTASLLTDMMQDVVKIGTGASLNSWFTSQPVSGKTGTTNDSKDLSFVAYTPYYTAGIWMGHDQPETLSATRNHINIWGNIMKDVHAGLERRQFETTTAGYVYATVCSTSGMLPTGNCPSSHSDYMRPEHVIEQYCTVHTNSYVTLCSASNGLPNDYCPADMLYRANVSSPVTHVCGVHTAPTEFEQLIPDISNFWPHTPPPQVQELEEEPAIQIPFLSQSEDTPQEEPDPTPTIEILPGRSQELTEPLPAEEVFIQQPEVIPEPEYVPTEDDQDTFFIPS
ncbi:MAG: hypothetical protein BEN19_03505 [Epulopiscium sp. Nuni2H_MBin003]|nr:MAG: hypothetical protein BEN19_03505 [Epulopiscium sp. Nuni2H_MBin003]